MKNNKTHQLVILNSIQDLQRLSLVLINSMRGRFQIKFGMTALFNDGAFTLIELLVVVLIIGILAAVAVPQYQKAVEKSKATQAKTLAKSAYQAAQTYKLANGNWPTKFEELAIEIPWTGNTKVTHASYHKTLSNDDWSLVLTHSDAANGIWVIRNSGKYANAGFVILKNNMVSNGKTVPGEQLLCVEGHSSNGFITSFQESHQTGDYCKKIIGGTEIMTTSAHRYFTL